MLKSESERASEQEREKLMNWLDLRTVSKMPVLVEKHPEEYKKQRRQTDPAFEYWAAISQLWPYV